MSHDNMAHFRTTQGFRVPGKISTASPITVGVGFFLRRDVASEDIAIIDANADPERRGPFPFPFRVEGLQFASHSERGPHTGFGVFRNALAPHVPADGHDGVTDKFINLT